MVYFSQETLHAWRPTTAEPADGGGALWLPGSILLELRMLPPVRGGPEVSPGPHCQPIIEM